MVLVLPLNLLAELLDFYPDSRTVRISSYIKVILQILLEYVYAAINHSPLLIQGGRVALYHDLL